MEKITQEQALKASCAGMANYFSDLYSKDKEFTIDYDTLKRTALGMYSVACYFNEDLIPDLMDYEEGVYILAKILDTSTDVVGILHNLNPEEFCDKHFVGYKDIKKGKEKMDLKARKEMN